MGISFASPTVLLVLAALLVASLALALFYFLRNRRNSFATPLERATFATLHTVALAAPALREGLSAQSARARTSSAAPAICARCSTRARSP